MQHLAEANRRPIGFIQLLISKFLGSRMKR